MYKVISIVLSIISKFETPHIINIIKLLLTIKLDKYKTFHTAYRLKYNIHVYFKNIKV